MENGSIGAASPEDDDPQDPSRKSSSAKRKANGDGAPRAKRNRYISIACNECKRRKIKCNGETPCHRCGNLSLECVYAPNCCSNGFRESEEYTQMNRQLVSLQEQIDTLAANLDAVQRKQNGVAALVQTAASTPLESFARDSPAASTKARRPQFAGSTGSVYDYEATNNGLQAMGINHGVLATDDVAETPKQHSDRDPLTEMSSEEALRLCTIYEDEVGGIMPMLNMEALTAKVKTFWSFMESMRRVGFLQKGVEAGEPFMDGETLILKLVLAIACVIEGGPSSEIGRAIFAHSKRVSAQSAAFDSPASAKTLKTWVLMAQYHFYADKEVQAYQILGLAARGCFGLGLHRSDALPRLYPDPEEMKWAIRLFWVIYHLDRRYSYGTGMPFAIQDADIDPQLPEPDAAVPFLQLMVSHGRRVSAKVGTSISGFANPDMDLRKNEMGFLDYSIQEWQSSIPDALRYQQSDNFTDANNLSRKQRHLRLLLHLYANSSRIQLYRPVLYSITSIMEDRGYAQTVVEIAKDTIRTLSQMYQVADMSRRTNASTHYFLVGALTVLFLAVAHAPMEFSQQVREEFYMASDMIRHCSSNSFLSRKLSSTVKGLKALTPELGLASAQNIYDVHAPNAAIDANGVYVNPSGGPMNGQQMSFELTNLFEAAGNYPGLRGNGMIAAHGGLPLDSFSLASGNEGDFLRIMKECF